MKKAKNCEEAWEMQDMRKGEPHCWIQWKGTNVCMDFYCACGRRSHIDADCAYTIKCPYCNKIYFCNGHIELIEVEEANQNGCVTDSNAIREIELDRLLEE